MFRLGGLESASRLRQLVRIARAQEAVESLRRGRRELAPVRRGQDLAEFARIEERHLRRGHQPFERQRRPRQDTCQYLLEDLDLLLDGGVLLVRFTLPGLQVLLLASLFPFLVLPALFSVQPIVFPALRDQTALEIRKTSAARHCSPGLGYDAYANDDNRGRRSAKAGRIAFSEAADSVEDHERVHGARGERDA
jgi:hypothetical protein